MDSALIAQIDSHNLRSRLKQFPSQCTKAWEMGLGFSLPSDYTKVERIVVLGMGGSAIAGDLLSDFLHRVDGPSIEVFRDYGLPGNLNENTLIIASSYSGNTDETLSGFRTALGQSCKVVAITSGGIMAREATEARIPLFLIDYFGEPRSALGFSFMLPLAIPGLLTVMGFAMYISWNDYILAFLFINSPENLMLNIALMKIALGGS